MHISPERIAKIEQLELDNARLRRMNGLLKKLLTKALEAVANRKR